MPDDLSRALTTYPPDDPRYWQVLAYALHLAAHRALVRADRLIALTARQTGE